MSPDEIARTHARVVELLSAQRDVLGSQLGSVLLGEGYYFGGYGGLFGFLRQHVPEAEWSPTGGAGDRRVSLRTSMEEASPSGGTPLSADPAQDSEPQATQDGSMGPTHSPSEEAGEASGSLWRAWTRPQLGVSLAWDGSARRVCIGRVGVDLPHGVIPLRQLFDADHQRIAGDFLEGVADIPELARESLAQLVAAGAPGWWTRLRDRLIELNWGQEWQEFRQQELDRHFERALRDQGIPLGEATSALRQLQASRRALRATNLRPAVQAPSVASDAKEKRRAAFLVALFSGLNTDVLRELRVPLGAVLDALDALNSTTETG